MHRLCACLQCNGSPDTLWLYDSMLMRCQKNIKAKMRKFHAPVFLYLPGFIVIKTTMINADREIRRESPALLQSFLCSKHRINDLQAFQILFLLPDVDIIRDDTNEKETKTIGGVLYDKPPYIKFSSFIYKICRDSIRFKGSEKVP